MTDTNFTPLFLNPEKKNKALILVPHQDDEINIASQSILQLKKSDVEIFVVYATNGDHDFTLNVRLQEAKRALHKLGIPKENIILLGYGDSSFKDCKNIYKSTSTITSASGHSRTYGTSEINDYRFIINNDHNSYEYKNFISDIETVLTSIKPNIIFCIDFDEHPDHRILFLSFQRVLGCLLKREKYFKSIQIFFGFAYPFAYHSKEDLHELNLQNIAYPKRDPHNYYTYEILGKSIYEWNERIRIPAGDTAQLPFASMFNQIGSALKCYTTQYGLKHSLSIINSENIYWERRTDNLLYDALISATSGNVSFINDFLLFDVEDVKSVNPSFSNYYWIPDSNDKFSELTFSFKEPLSANQLLIYGRIDIKKDSYELEISLDNKYTQRLTCACIYGRPVKISLPDDLIFETCRIKILRYSRDTFGIAEMEMFTSKKNISYIRPFMKLEIDNSFSNYILLHPKAVNVKVNIYKYCCSQQVIIETSNPCCTYDSKEKKLSIPTTLKEVTVLVLDDHNKCLHKVNIHRLSFTEFMIYKFLQRFDALRIKRSVLISREQRLMQYIKAKGIKYIWLRILHKIR